MNAVVSVIGKDRVGILARVSTECANANVNVLEVTQTLLQDTFAMTMLVDISACKLPFTVLSTLLENEGAKRGLAIKVQREDIFSAMHKI